MMRPIKFRGKAWAGAPTDDFDGWLYGDLIHFNDAVLIKDDEWGEVEVYPESVAQLVGYDKDGNEIYEGDVLIDSEGNSVEFNMAVVDDLGVVAGNIGDTFEELALLKE